MEIKGAQFGVRLEKNSAKADDIFVQLLSEDDDNWFDVGNGFSSYWLNDLITVLEAARVQSIIMMGNHPGRVA